MDIEDLIREAHETAVESGWHERDVPICTAKGGPGLPPSGVNYEAVGSLLAMIGGEVSEALECVRTDDWTMTRRGDVDGNGKPEGFTTELADVWIRIGDLLEALGLAEDFERALHAKLAYNKTRPHRHGGRKL